MQTTESWEGACIRLGHQIPAHAQVDGEGAGPACLCLLEADQEELAPAGDLPDSSTLHPSPEMRAAGGGQTPRPGESASGDAAPGNGRLTAAPVHKSTPNGLDFGKFRHGLLSLTRKLSRGYRKARQVSIAEGEQQPGQTA